MVRVISEKLFSPPRSRHSSGEAVDKELAARAVEALSSLNSSTTSASSRRSVAVAELSDYESSSDSHWEWDSEVDIEGDGGDNNHAGGAPSSSTEENSNLGGECSGGEDVLQKRKERRRERNKLSAQAYRIRRREQCVKQQTVLRDLQDKNWRLKEQVHTLEEEIDHLRRTAVVRPPPPPPPLPPGRSKAANPMSATTADMTSTTSDRHSSLHSPGNGTVQENRSCLPHCRLMDNDSTRSQPLSCPLVDNFSFSQPSPALASSPAASPGAGSSSSLRFSFSPPPVPRAPPGAGHAVGQGHHLIRPPAMFPKASSVPPADCASFSVREQVPLSQGRIYSHSQYPFQIAPPSADPQHTDLNANAEEGRDNLNTTTHIAGLGSRQRNDNVNNNMDNTTTKLAVPPHGGARPKTKAVGPPTRPVHGCSEMFKFPKV